MSRSLVSKELWQQLQPLIPAFAASTKVGPRSLNVSDEAALNGIFFVLHTSIPWEDLPQYLLNNRPRETLNGRSPYQVFKAFMLEMNGKQVMDAVH